ncbi:MAG: hypothetical protein J6R22_02880 [Alphaproteobacteria bacterium]|nr:hypothetical protein [Alphaproteobacteria bacterium]
MKREDLLFAIGLASLIGSAYVMKLVRNKEQTDKERWEKERNERIEQYGDLHRELTISMYGEEIFNNPRIHMD